MNTDDLARLAGMLEKFHQEYKVSLSDKQMNALGAVNDVVWNAALTGTGVRSVDFYNLVMYHVRGVIDSEDKS